MATVASLDLLSDFIHFLVDALQVTFPNSPAPKHEDVSPQAYTVHPVTVTRPPNPKSMRLHTRLTCSMGSIASAGGRWCVWLLCYLQCRLLPIVADCCSPTAKSRTEPQVEVPRRTSNPIPPLHDGQEAHRAHRQQRCNIDVCRFYCTHFSDALRRRML